MSRLRTFLAAGLLLLHGAAPASAADVNPLIRVFELTNIERQKAGVPPLALSSELSAAAQEYSVVLATTDCFSHNCGPKPDMADRLGQAGYRGWTTIAENIAAGYPTPEAVVQGWMSSPGHRENLLSPYYKEIGLGVATGGGRYGIFWTQDFGSRHVMPAPAESVVEMAAAEEAPASPAEDEMPPAEEEPASEE